MDEEGDEKESAAKKLCPSVGGHPKPLLSEIGKRISRSERTPRHSTCTINHEETKCITQNAAQNTAQEGSVQTTL